MLSEFDSFTNKFKHLWSSGKEADLPMNSKNGNLWISLSLGPNVLHIHHYHHLLGIHNLALDPHAILHHSNVVIHDGKLSVKLVLKRQIVLRKQMLRTYQPQK